MQLVVIVMSNKTYKKMNFPKDYHLTFEKSPSKYIHLEMKNSTSLLLVFCFENPVIVFGADRVGRDINLDDS